VPQGLQKRTEGAPPWLVTISRRSTVSLMHETISSPEPRRFVRTFGLDLQAVKHALGPEPMLTAPPVVGLDELLLSMADDEFVIGFSDSEWTGIAPILEEDVAMSSLSQDELGHAAALYALLAGISDTDADAIAYDRQPEAYRHARLLDHGRGDWAMTIARRYLYETADAVRLEALAGGAWSPLAELVGKLQREERYHQMHVESWLARLASSPGEPRDRLIQALGALGPDAGTVFTPLAGERELIDGGVLARPMTELELDWRTRVATAFGPLDLPLPPPTVDRDRGRRVHAEPFHWLWTEFTTVRQSDPGATW
jgi:ring-1,2-phenylacetyl-CoA epoxidase subunit PaaC